MTQTNLHRFGETASLSGGFNFACIPCSCFGSVPCTRSITPAELYTVLWQVAEAESSSRMSQFSHLN